jgi:hypothetical protein
VTKIISAKTGKELKSDDETSSARTLNFGEINMMELKYEEYKVLSMAFEAEDGNSHPFSVELHLQYARVGTLAIGEVSLIISCVIIWIIFYVLSYLHCAKIVDLFKPCRKKPLTPEELARIFYAKEIHMALARISPVEEVTIDPKTKKRMVKNQKSPRTREREAQEEHTRRCLNDESMKDSFFKDDPYIGVKHDKIYADKNEKKDEDAHNPNSIMDIQLFIHDP